MTLQLYWSSDQILATLGSHLSGILPGTQKSFSECLLNSGANTSKTWKIDGCTLQGELGNSERIKTWTKKKKTMVILCVIWFSCLLEAVALFSSTYQNVATRRPFLFVDGVYKWLPVQNKRSIEMEHNYLGTCPVLWHCLTPKNVITRSVLLSSVQMSPRLV